ncbi:MAG TPA: DUF3179 domain-containing (seleno)protein [Tepidisphaeraceae bacterium]
MTIAILLLLLAWSAAGWLAYGLDPRATADFGGLAMITFTRRMQWILLVLAILPCLLLIARVTVGKNRAAWLLGLSLVVALLFVRFAPDKRRPIRVIDGPTLPLLTEVPPVGDEEFVVGFQFEGSAYAFPYRALHRTPIIQLTDFDQRLILIFSPFANSATALDVNREVRATDLEYVTSPDNSTLAYNRKYGQFIVGVTGLTDKRQPSVNVNSQLQVFRVPLRVWRRMHPQSRWLRPFGRDMDYPGVPLAPNFRSPSIDASLPGDQPITLLHTTPPAALLEEVPYKWPINIKSGDTAIVAWHGEFGEVRAFERVVDGDFFLTFTSAVHANGTTKFFDEQTRSTWSVKGVCTDGPRKGSKLAPVRVDERVYWGVSKTWWPELTLLHPPTVPR